MAASRSLADALQADGHPAAPDETVSIYDAIRKAILSGRYAPGERLIEAQLASELGVSRTRIRDALSRLQAEQLVAPAANRGLVVRALGHRDIEELYALRLLLEGFAARTAAGSITTRELDDLRVVHQRMVEVENAAAGSDGQARLEMIRAVTDINNEFHRLIQRASRNSRLDAVLRQVVERPLVFQSFYWYSDRELAEALAEHAAIVEALAQHDSALAETLMTRHISRGLNTLLREMTQAN